MATVMLNGVATWYEERGHGDPLVLLHPGGAGVDARAFGPNLDALAQHFHVFTPERRAHGRTPDVEGPITYELMAQDTIAFLDTVIGQPVHLLGYSDGAVVALLVALSRPDLVSRLVLAAGIFHHEGWHEGVLDGEPPAFLRDSYGQISPDGIGHYDVVAAKLAATHADEPALDASELQELTTRTLVMVADDDEVRLEHAVEMYRGLPDAELAVVPGTSHGLLMEKPDMCHQLITDFLSQDPVATLAPIRRATPAVKP